MREAYTQEFSDLNEMGAGGTVAVDTVSWDDADLFENWTFEDADDERLVEAAHLVDISDVSYEQGDNEFGYMGTCGPTSQANALNLLFGTDRFSENEVLTVAVENGLCETSSPNPAECGGTTTAQFMELYDEVRRETGASFSTELYEGAQALSADAVAQRLEQGDVVNVAVDANALWGTGGDGFDFLGVRMPSSAPSNHWITVAGVQRDAAGEVCGFDIVDSGGGVDSVDIDTYNAMCFGADGHTVTDPTCIVVSKN